MFDRSLRHASQPALTAVARPLAAKGVRANHLTAFALLLAIVAAGLAARQWVVVPVVLWLLSRVLDGLDGALARLSVTADTRASDLGGFYDILGDFAAYAAVPVGLAVAHPEARLALVVLLAAYYLSGSTFLAFSSIAERRGMQTDERSFQFIGRLTEGAETIAVTTAMLLWPGAAELLAWGFAGLVSLGVLERILVARRQLLS